MFVCVPLDISNDGATIERLLATAFLCVPTDNQLCWNGHVKLIQAEVAKTVAGMSKAKYVLDHHMYVHVYNKLLYPILPYIVYTSLFKLVF